MWHKEISQSILRHISSRIFFSGIILQNSLSEEYNEDCSQPIMDLLDSLPRSSSDMVFTYNLSDINAVLRELRIPWEPSKDQPFAVSMIYTVLVSGGI